MNRPQRRLGDGLERFIAQSMVVAYS